MNKTPHTTKTQSITRWIEELRKGDGAAAEMLWQFLKSRLMSLASRKVGFAISYDQDDVALDAFATLCEGIQEGRYDISDRNALWSLLAVITINGARKHSRDEKRLRRGGGLSKSSKNDKELNSIATKELSPEVSFFAKEECKRLLSILPNEGLKHLAVLKVDGYTNDEIANKLECTRRSIQRRLNLIRQIWTNELNG
jgi:DNA-directed RNA polymerase specialized sigma24 family protein